MTPLSANPTYLRFITGDGVRRSLRIPDDDWRNRYPSGRNAKYILAVRRVEEALRETDPTGAKSASVCGEHQIFRSKCTVLDDPRTLRAR